MPATKRKDRGKTRLIRAMGDANGKEGVAGLIAGKGGQKKPETGGSANLASVGAHLHDGPVGAKRKRWPWMRWAFLKNRLKYKRLLAKELGRIVAGRSTAREALLRIAREGRNDQVLALTAIRKPNLEQSTIKAKGSSNPLIDRGTLREAHGFEVRD